MCWRMCFTDASRSPLLSWRSTTSSGLVPDPGGQVLTVYTETGALTPLSLYSDFFCNTELSRAIDHWVSLSSEHRMSPVCHGSQGHHNRIAANYLGHRIFLSAKGFVTHRPQNNTYKKPLFLALCAAPYRAL